MTWCANDWWDLPRPNDQSETYHGPMTHGTYNVPVDIEPLPQSVLTEQGGQYRTAVN
jgi:hypothetical protein